MGTTAAILAILTAVVPFLIWFYKRKAAQHDDCLVQQKEQDEKIDKAIADNDVDFVNTFVHDKLQDKGSRNSSGQSDNIRRD